jgi:hypothetical protein
LTLCSRTFACFASPLAWTCIYCFSGEDEDNEGSEWDVRMECGPCKRPHICCCSCIVPCFTQWWVRRRVLDHDMTRYKCFQGMLDGPHCCAACSPSLPCTVEAGTYGESTCPDLCLCLETCCCTYIAFQASRMVIREDRNLKMDPTEIRVENCLDFFGSIAIALCCAGCCLQICGCCLTCNGQDEAGESMGNLGAACSRMSSEIIEGMRWVMMIAMACMSSQMMHELSLPIDPKAIQMGNPAQQFMEDS